jgi:hypothetical protein
MAYRGGSKNRPSRANWLSAIKPSVSGNSTRTNFLSGTSENTGRNLSDFRLFTLSGLFALKSPIQNKSQTACAICAMETLPISII